jgi:hypothetical protein
MGVFFEDDDLEESFERFERAAAKGHEEAIWVLSVVKDMEKKRILLKKAFAKTGEPLGWWFAGRLSDGREAFDFYKKSAEGGCSWGQVAYGEYFLRGDFVEKDRKVFVAWLEKAAKQNNPKAMHLLGDWFRDEEGRDKEKALSYYRAAAELGWKGSMYFLAQMLRDGEGCPKDLRQAVIWSAKASESFVFWSLLGEAGRVLETQATETLDCDFNQLCYSIGWGLYWYRGSYDRDEGDVFSNLYLDFYCSCVELQQKSIFTFLLCWNRMTGGVKGPGQMIAHMVWEAREDNLVKTFEQTNEGEEPKTKRIKK